MVDVLRAFSTAAYAIARGVRAIWLVATVDEALERASREPGLFTVGEENGRRPVVFDFPNSPTAMNHADLIGKVLVQRTSSGTQGALAAVSAERLFATSLVCASATARALATESAVTYVISGRRRDELGSGEDDYLTAKLVERARRGEPLRARSTAKLVASTQWARALRDIGPPDVGVDDIELATDVDRFDFAMEIERVDGGLRLRATRAAG